MDAEGEPTELPTLAPSGDEIFDRSILGNSVLNWALSLLAFAATLLFWRIVLPFVWKCFNLQQQRSIGDDHLRIDPNSPWIEVVTRIVKRTNWISLLVFAAWVGQRFLTLPERLDKYSTSVTIVVFWIQVALWGSTSAKYLIQQRGIRLTETSPTARKGVDRILFFLIRVLLFSICAMLALQNLGIDIVALVAGLGVGGVALALAAQSILGDLLASLSITLDKPFVEGDWLRIDTTIEGVVEQIGVRSTRLRSVDGEQITLSNTDLCKSRIRNLGRMPERRWLFKLGIDSDTPPEKVAMIPSIVACAVSAVDGTRFDYCGLRSFGENSLDFEIVYFVPTVNAFAERHKFININDEVNRKIHATLVSEDIRLSGPDLSTFFRAVGQPLRKS
jgi:small-conductance mechanosensitive channel